MVSAASMIRSTRKAFDLYQSQREIVLTPEENELKRALESNFHHFVGWSWNFIETVPFVDGWHLQAMCRHLELAARFETKSLIINIPPRCAKSTILSMFNAWVWAQHPHLKFLCISGSKSLAIKDSNRCRRIIEAKEYKKFWGHLVKIRVDSKAKQSYETTAHGQRLSRSMRGSVRGEGGNFLIIDDGNTDQDYVSDTTREAANEYLDSNISLRESDPKKTCLINVQQRLHEFDLTGHMLKKGGALVHFRLPMEFEADNPCKTVPLKAGESPWIDPRTIDGELLWPQRFDQEAVERAKLNLRTDYNIAGQLQQRPAPRQGGLIKRAWFQIWKDARLPETMMVLQSWDTALTVSADSCYSACTTWGVFQDDRGYNNLVLLNAWRGKLEYPDLKTMMIRCSEDYFCQDLLSPVKPVRRPDIILLEKAANGDSLIQDLHRSGITVTPFNPRHFGFTSSGGFGKIGRAILASSLIEQGFVHVPAVAPKFDVLYKYADMFLTAIQSFPRGDGADLVDSMSQAILYLMRTQELIYRGQKEDTPFDWRSVATSSRLMEGDTNLYGRL